MNTTVSPATGDDYDRFAPFYDLEFADFSDDWPLYAAFAEHCAGKVLELGCGTGRLLVPLADAGYTVTGVDCSAAMLTRAQAAVDAAGVSAQVTLVQDDMRSLNRVQKEHFALAFSAINSFLHLTTQEDQLAALGAIQRALVPGGVLLLDLFPPHPDILNDYDGRLIHAGVYTDPADGSRIDKFSTTVLDPAEQRMETVFFYDRLHINGRFERVAAPFTFRYVGRYELQLLLERAGYVDIAFQGSYDMAPFSAESERMIAIARRPE